MEELSRIANLWTHFGNADRKVALSDFAGNDQRRTQIQRAFFFGNRQRERERERKISAIRDSLCAVFWGVFAEIDGVLFRRFVCADRVERERRDAVAGLNSFHGTFASFVVFEKESRSDREVFSIVPTSKTQTTGHSSPLGVASEVGTAECF